MSGARARLGHASALARFAAHPHARRRAACVQLSAAATAAASTPTRSPSSRVLLPRPPPLDLTPRADARGHL
jgi:hypothetical protein